MKSSVALFYISISSLFSVHTGAYFFIAKRPKSSLPQSPVCMFDLTETSSHIYRAGPPEALAYLQSLAQHGSPAGKCAAGAVPGREGSGR